MRVHNIHECDADIPTLLKVPPSKINWKESLEEGYDHLSCVGRSVDVCCLGASIFMYDTTSSWWWEVWVQLRSRIWRSSVTAHSTRVLELLWLEVTVVASRRDRGCTPSVTVVVGNDTKTLPKMAFFSCCFLRRFWGRKRREKRREKVRGAQC